MAVEGGRREAYIGGEEREEEEKQLGVMFQQKEEWEDEYKEDISLLFFSISLAVLAVLNAGEIWRHIFLLKLLHILNLNTCD